MELSYSSNDSFRTFYTNSYSLFISDGRFEIEFGRLESEEYITSLLLRDDELWIRTNFGLYVHETVEFERLHEFQLTN